VKNHPALAGGEVNEREAKDTVGVGGESALDVWGDLEELRSEITGRSHGLAPTEVVSRDESGRAGNAGSD